MARSDPQTSPGVAQSYGDLWRLILRARPPTGVLLTAALLSLLSAAALLTYPLLTQRLVDGLGSGQPIAVPSLVLIGVLLAGTLFGALAELLLARTGHAVTGRLRQLLVARMLALPVTYYEQTDTGERVSRVINDCESISGLTTRQVISLLNGVLMLIGSVLILVWLDGWLTLVLFVTLLVAFVAIAPAVVRIESVAKAVQERTARLSGLLTHVFTEIRLVKAHVGEAHEADRGRGQIEDLRRHHNRMALLRIVLETISGLAMVGALIVILVYGGMRVARGDLSMGVLTAFILYIFNVVAPFGQIGGFFAELQSAKGASARLGAILDSAEESEATGDAVPVDGAVLEFRGVRFCYPGRPEPVLDGLDLRIEPGTTTALVGLSGSGKSTVLALIERFHRAGEGEIVYDGRPLQDYDLAGWRQRIGYVAQNAPIMPGSVRDNIAYGLGDTVTEAAVVAAAERAQAMDFIRVLPEGLDTLLAEQGSNLSGGQRQRIALARVLLRDPELLLLDEATSSLDSETEHAIQHALDECRRGRTNLIIAHRLSTIRHADRICFMEGGRITATGSHEQLYRDHPVYASLADRQFSS